MNDIERETFEGLIRVASPRHFRSRERFRLSRRGFYALLSKIQEDLSPRTTRTASIGASHKLAIFLEHVGSSSLQRTTGVTLGCSQATVSRVIAEVSDLFYRRRKEFIRWPSFSEQRDMERRFFNFCGIPRVVGAIDGSHIKIIAPSDSEDSYVNRKDYHSINMGAVCDLNQKFLWVSVKYPGRAHDSRVFRSSRLYSDLLEGRKMGVLLGDSAYRSERFLLKPILRENRTPAETRYTNAVCRGRVVIENAFGSLKRQFQVLHTELRHTPSKSAKIIISCCCIRNFAISMRESPFTDTESIPPSYPEAGDEETDLPEMGNEFRRSIIDGYFA